MNANISERVERLKAASSPGESWLPHRNDEQPRQIIGEILARGTWEGGYGPCATLKVLDAQTGVVWRVYMSGSVLEGEVDDQDPRPGDLIALTYGGLVQNKAKASEYHSWTVAVDKGTRRATEPEIPIEASEPAEVQSDDDIPF